MFRYLCRLVVLQICLLSAPLLAASADSLCPEKPTATDGCIEVQDWDELKLTITKSNGVVVLCPFNITKTSRDPISILHGVTIMCLKASDDDECTIRGEGVHIQSYSDTEILFQGITFKESDENAVYIQSGVDTNIHTFCDCRFEGNKRMDDIRGGSFKTEPGTGIVNIVWCTFENNYAFMGGAVYVRNNFTNIVGSVFINNTSAGQGGAIMAANYADISIESSIFIGNFGQDSYAIVIKPVAGPAVFIDGGNNLSTENGSCDGFFDWEAGSCTEFTDPGVSMAPSASMAPNMSMTPSVSPSVSPTTSAPTRSYQPSVSPSAHPSTSPTMTPTDAPSQSPTRSQSPSISLSPSMAPTSVEDSKCGDLEQYYGEPCVQIENWTAFLEAIRNASDHLVLCPFAITNDSGMAAVIGKDITVVCPLHNCTIAGAGAHLRVQGDTSVLISGLTFKGSEQSAVHVETSSRLATTTFCQCYFQNNRRLDSQGGGALAAADNSGEVNVVNCNFYLNSASTGGAILSRAFRLNAISCNFSENNAETWGGSIFVSWDSHLLVRGCTFSRNTAGVGRNYSIVVRPSGNETGIPGTWVDAGDNVSERDGDCSGYYIGELATCQQFSSLPASSSLVYPYVLGELSVYDEPTGLRLASGLSVRQIARSGEPVVFGSVLANYSRSSLPFHVEPDGAAVVATNDGGWIYVSNCESSLGNYQGGVYALAFDSEGEIKDYYTLLTNTTRNCNGGLTPWDTFVSCEETAHGQCWQVDPLGIRDPEPTAMTEQERGNFEAFAYDIRNSSRPCFFVTEDHDRGALRRWCPDPGSVNETWNMLHGNGTLDYLKIIPGTNRFEWTPDLNEGRDSANAFFPTSEGISHKDGILYFVIKGLKLLYICNLDSGEFRTESPNDQGLLIGDGSFTGHPDYVSRGAGSDLLYFTEDGGRPGLYARRTSTGEYFAIMEAEHDKYKHDEATGLSWSPDWTRLYVCMQDNGILFEITRDDGLPFEHDDQQLHLKYHSTSRYRYMPQKIMD